MYRTAYRLTIVVIFLALVATLGGLFMKSLYRDNIFVTSAWKGSDFVTLVVALPLLIVSLILSMRGSQRAQLVWLGMVYYMLYNYAFYLFGAAFNSFFLIYVAIFTLSLFTLIYGLISLDVEAIGWKFQNGVPVKWISVYMMMLALGLFGFYAKQIIDFIFNGILPAIVIMTGHPTSLIYALDLSLLVPSLVIGAIWLWKRHDWGFILAGILISLVSLAFDGICDRLSLPSWAASCCKVRKKIKQTISLLAGVLNLSLHNCIQMCYAIVEINECSNLSGVDRYSFTKEFYANSL